MYKKEENEKTSTAAVAVGSVDAVDVGWKVAGLKLLAELKASRARLENTRDGVVGVLGADEKRVATGLDLVRGLLAHLRSGR